MSSGDRNPGGQRRWSLICGASVLLLGSIVTRAAEISDIVAVPVAGQTAEQQRRDRYECHNWVIAQNRTLPAPRPAREETDRERRASRIGKVITGAAVGAAAGGIIRGARDYRDANDGALAGGVLGAIAGAVIGGAQEGESEDEDESFNDYFRALDACMTGRGYDLRIAKTQ